ncbi:MAG TPA: 4-alpha-glucanotransferase [Jatrophihabitantaceae bacterium]|nr:4-alpha-glucanotransferase [Jatrophihabitantaceae bacterium]
MPGRALLFAAYVAVANPGRPVLRRVRLDDRVAESAGDLRELATAYGVATEYWDWRGRHVAVSAETLTAVLAALGVDTATPARRREALESRRLVAWRQVLPPYVVTRTGQASAVTVHVPHGASVDVWIELEDGSYRSALQQLENWTKPVEVDGRLIGEASFEIPDDIPSGYHVVGAYCQGAGSRSSLIVTPAWLGLPTQVGSAPVWGLATQIYSVRSRRSWGIGDLADLTDLAAWAAEEHGADFVLVNPLHAAAPGVPMEPSPYLPTTRRFANPMYLRVERIPEYAYLDAAARGQLDVLGARLRKTTGERIERDPAWTAKRAALQLVHAAGLEFGRAFSYAAFRRREGQALDDFATWCALSEQHGTDWRQWPAELRHPRSPAVTEFAATHPSEVDFHRWLEWVLDEQLADTQATVRRVGMRLGVVHDLAVGVSLSGADAWAWQDALAQGITVGAPPDAYAQTGQDWNQPAWRPDRLAELGYAPFRDLIANALRHSGGLRVDHIIGMFRLWWIPAGADPTEGTYVRYDHDAAIGILALEAQRAGAVVIGEDLGTVEPWVRAYLRERGVLGTSILWFEFDYDGAGGPLEPERWREFCLASVTTHDLPPTAGYLAGDHIRLRHRLGLLTRPLDEELAADHTEREAWLDELRRRGLLTEGADEEEIVRALHRALAATPSRLRCLALTDAVGDRRAQNQPGTVDEYPNWQVPLSGPDGTPLTLEDVFTNDRAAALAEVMRA